MLNIEREVDHKDVKDFWELNTWREETKKKIRETLETGAWVQLGCTAIGHTRTQITEQDGIDWLVSEYGDTLQWGRDTMFGKPCARLR